MASRKRIFLKRKIKKIAIYLSSFLFLFLTLFLFYLSFLILSLPDIYVNQNESTKIYDRTGNYLIYEIGPKKTLISPQEIPDLVKKAVISAEDKDFYKHKGISPKGIIRAIWLNIKEGSPRYGGSTITQQLARNLFLSTKKTFTRKIKEIILAIILEKKYSKDEILAAYLNNINFGEGRYGIESAAEFYFGKKANELSLEEIALLVGIPKAPSIYSPIRNSDLALKRRNYVLKRMLEDGYISQEDYKRALEKPIQLNITREKNLQALHFSLEVKSFLENNFPDINLEVAGLKVITTLNYELQKKAEELVKKYAEINKEKFKAKNAALLAMDPETGEVLVMVGSKDYFDKSIDGAVNVTLRPKQVGSTIKPFIYSVFFEKGYPDNMILFDVPTNFSVNPRKPFTPNNWDKNFRGPITVRQSLAQSINVTSIKVLYLAGYDEVIKKLKELELIKQEKDYGLSLVLGTPEIRLIDLVRAYSALATEGFQPSFSFIKEIYDSKGNLIYKYEPQRKKVIPENIARIINDILSDDDARIGVFMPNSKLNIPGWQVAVKTGTTQNSRDAWTVGYLPFLVVGVWGGNNDETPMDQAGAGFSVSVPLWNEFLSYALSRPEYLKLKNIKKFNKPEIQRIEKPLLNGEWQFVEIKPFDKITNQPTKNYDNVNFKNAIVIHSELYFIDRKDPLGPPPKNPYLDAQFENWEKGVINWALSKKNEFELPLWYDESFIQSLSQN